ncbi:GNAT family N-acetyltransferase [Denitrobaculum tricleocarpae]|uniref:GNAT family N-acetyltransferase n=1 Tax=Denitrobaculum tricleocarpae TaxID=2591009 RepID=A0A545TGB0_9PROT|nr:GNAT family N-acetyltransferase [Denitrobaculum tricleocarpae]TQV76263.1 GNAT family N-acetyltransferase [Denitrobaculum tricleocarpae]
MTASYQVSCDEIADLSEFGNAWQELEAGGHASFFQSWCWVGTWLSTLPDSFKAKALRISQGDRLAGLGVLMFHAGHRHRIMPVGRLLLNETGDAHHDRLTLEYSGILCDTRERLGITEAAFRWLDGTDRSWSELCLSGLLPETMSDVSKAADAVGLMPWIQDLKPCDYVDLSIVRDRKEDYLTQLSRNTRQQLRKALRLYEADGPLSLTAPDNLDEAHRFLDELTQLHQSYWIARGETGSFSNDYFRKFHRALVTAGFPEGKIQLLRASAGDQPIGYLYNFLHDGTVYGYQSGFRYDDDPKRKPGLVTHYLAIERNLAQGAGIYDFMAGYGQHKRSLGNATQDMTWLVLQRNILKNRVEQRLRGLKQQLAERKKAQRQPD